MKETTWITTFTEGEEPQIKHSFSNGQSIVYLYKTNKVYKFDSKGCLVACIDAADMSVKAFYDLLVELNNLQ